MRSTSGLLATTTATSEEEELGEAPLAADVTETPPPATLDVDASRVAARENILANVLEAAPDDARVASVPLTIPIDWVGDCQLDIRLPRRVRCALCEGGGCSRCDNRGGYEVPEATTVRLNARIPSAGAKVRVMRPLGEDAAIDVVVFRVAIGDAASTSIVRHEPRAASLALPSPNPPSAIRWVVGIAAVVAIVLLSLALR